MLNVFVFPDGVNCTLLLYGYYAVWNGPFGCEMPFDHSFEMDCGEL